MEMEKSNLTEPHYSLLMRDKGLVPSMLPESLNQLIEKFEDAFLATSQTDRAKQDSYFPVLIMTDAAISAELEKLFPSEKKVNSARMKMLELEAKAREREGIK